ncbi:MAG: FlgD immunoglobulin-like domain containing protein [Candidatus Fermentibacter sp.]|nr:FlgD immunoglobulin-like domain containing protein [Candidatus Fermentibacter sp.]
MISALMACAALSAWTVEPAEPTLLVFPPYGHCMGIYRAGTDQLAMLLGGLVRFDDPQGLACVKLTEWNSPGEEDDDELAVYGVNSRTGHVIYNANMYTLGLYGGNGAGDAQLSSPHGIAADASGLVVVADTGNGRVVVLERRGTRMRAREFIEGGLSEPWGVAIGDRHSIYVTDRALGTLLIYDSPSDSTPSTVSLDTPTGLAVYGEGQWNALDEDFAVAVTAGGTSLCRIEDGGVTATATLDDCGGSVFNYPVIDYYGNTWVSDSISCRIHKFDPDLDYVASFGSPGTGDRQFDHPTGLAMWRRYGQVFVAEREGARYFWVGTDMAPGVLSATGRGCSVSGTLFEKSMVLAQVTDASGTAVATLHNGRMEEGGFSLSWDGTDVLGDPVQGGTMELVIRIEPTYSSRGYFSKTYSQSFQMDLVEVAAPDSTGRSGRRS